MIVEKEALLEKAITIIDEFEWENLVIAYDDVKNAQDAQRYGCWIKDETEKCCSAHEYYDCSECGEQISDRYGLFPYCPYCGAKMAVEHEDN